MEAFAASGVPRTIVHHRTGRQRTRSAACMHAVDRAPCAPPPPPPKPKLLLYSGEGRVVSVVCVCTVCEELVSRRKGQYSKITPQFAPPAPLAYQSAITGDCRCSGSIRDTYDGTVLRTRTHKHTESHWIHNAISAQFSRFSAHRLHPPSPSTPSRRTAVTTLCLHLHARSGEGCTGSRARDGSHPSCVLSRLCPNRRHG